MRRRILFTGLLLGMGLGAAPLAWSQVEYWQSRLHQDSTFMQRHRIRTVTEFWSADEEHPQQLAEQTTTRYSRTGRWLSADDPHADDPDYETRGPRREEVYVKDAQGRTEATEHHIDGELESVEHWLYGWHDKVIQRYVHETGLYGQPERWDFKETTHYDLRGNAVEGVYNGANMLYGRLSFPTRWRASYDYAGRRIATVEYQELIYPKRTDSTYYNDRGQVIRQVSYYYRQGQPQLGDLWVQQYDAAGRLVQRIETENGGQWQKILLMRYRPDGLPAGSVQYSAHLPAVSNWLQALRRTVDTLRLARDFAQEHHIYRYNQRGLQEEISRYKHPGTGPLNEAQDLVWRDVWRYTYYR
ncbi:hypothetical protein EJV47_19240 [Hymenobacter gummosus]|uniref:RHS repeat protein n=1 Tax=Hymenobacter gummosus TaxID=1776032 RepID=A0A431TZZ9_9BACT|nr:hypothetical protein [Hymenobacter gummosus]RTQ47551.1 hypothetical protein EJV47_19240 [Hymenobacter gummosus]